MACTEVKWANELPETEWAHQRRVIALATERGIRFALGGGLAFSTYAGRWRNTKDVDLFILRRDRDAMVELTREAGLVDLYDRLPYDRAWIYRATRDDAIVDLIWQMANGCADVEERWLTRGPEVLVQGLRLRLAPIEEPIFSKLFVLQRDRSDWPDIANILASSVLRVDWDRLLALVSEDNLLLLGGVLSVFRWLAPRRASAVPAQVWDRVGLRADAALPPAFDECRNARLLDSRDWFGADMPGSL